MGSVQQAAVEAYGARLSMKKSNYNSVSIDEDDFLESQRRMFNSTRNKQFGISKTMNGIDNLKSNVVVETKQENASCFFWPFFDQSYSQYNQSNVYISPEIKKAQKMARKHPTTQPRPATLSQQVEQI